MKTGLLRTFHGCATIVWFAMIPVVLLTNLKSSLPFLVGISVYALGVGHFASWQAARAEDAQPDADDTML